MTNNRVWIIPANDAESKLIGDMLARNGEQYIVDGQGWGASWSGLKPDTLRQLGKISDFEISNEVVEKVEKIDARLGEIGSVIWSKSGDEKAALQQEQTNLQNERREVTTHALEEVGQKANSEGVSIYGVEFQNNIPGMNNVDHHTYSDDDRSNPKSSIEQVADILGVEMTNFEKMIAANDVGYIPGMQAEATKLGMNKEEAQKVISQIRMIERETQGITKEHEAEAERAIAELGKIAEKNKLLVVHMAHSKTSPVTDRLFGKYDNLLIVSGDGETNFYGETKIINALMAAFANETSSNCWKGGNLEGGSGFWGGYADQRAIEALVREMAAEKKAPITLANVDASVEVEKTEEAKNTNRE